MYRKIPEGTKLEYQKGHQNAQSISEVEIGIHARRDTLGNCFATEEIHQSILSVFPLYILSSLMMSQLLCEEMD